MNDLYEEFAVGKVEDIAPHSLKQSHISPQTQQLIDSLRTAGVPILHSGEGLVRPLVVEEGKGQVVHTHRRTDNEDIFYIASIEDRPLTVTFRLQGNPKRATLWDNCTGQRHRLRANRDGSFTLQLQPMTSVFVTVENIG